MLKLQNVIKPIGVGVTIPHLVELSNGLKYVLKFPGNPEGEKALINEFICYELALMLDLPIIESSVIEIDFSTVSGLDCVHSSIIQRNGLGFASLYNTRANPINTPSIIKLAHNSCELYKIIIFDFLIGNTDRNKGNLLYDSKFKKINIIDHTHVFSIGTLWNTNELTRRLGEPFSIDDAHHYNFENYLQFKNYRIECSSSIKRFIQKISLIRKDDLERIINKCRNIWIFDENDVISLCNYLWDRITRLDEILNLLNLNKEGVQIT